MNTPIAASSARVSGGNVLIIGGGPTGSTAAASLVERGCGVPLLEKFASSFSISGAPCRPDGYLNSIFGSFLKRLRW